MKETAGLLMYRRAAGVLQVFLVHPGGPIWAARDAGAWTMPKGELDAGEDPLSGARREFFEETGFTAGAPFRELGTHEQSKKKRLTAYAFEGDCDPAAMQSNTCEIEWPPKTGKRLEIPEVDRGAWFGLNEARERIRPAQVVFLDELLDILVKP